MKFSSLKMPEFGGLILSPSVYLTSALHSADFGLVSAVGWQNR
jgi:hypothetical protein